MDEINNIYNVNSPNIENKKIKKDETKKTIRSKTGNLSEQMTYLGAINRVNIKKPASFDTKKQILSDGGLSNDTDLNKEMSDEEKISLISKKAKSVNLDLDDNFIKQILATKDISIEEIDKFIDACTKVKDSNGNCKFFADDISSFLEISNIDINKTTSLIEACSKV